MTKDKYTLKEIELLNQDVDSYNSRHSNKQQWHRYEGGKIRILTKEEVSKMKEDFKNKTSR